MTRFVNYADWRAKISLKVCQDKQVPLGFTIQDAVLYQIIIGDFSDNNLLTLVHAGCTIQQVVAICLGATAGTILRGGTRSSWWRMCCAPAQARLTMVAIWRR